MKMKTFKNQNGITLVALVVTIVVLLILAGISINAVLGNNGLISKAKDAKTQTEQDQVNTEKGMNNLYDEMMSILGENGGSGNEGEGDGSGGGTDDSGNEGDGSDETPTIPQIGDYVNYTYDTVSEGYALPETQSGYPDQTVPQSSTTLKWRILNIDETNGTIDLVSENPSDNTVYFQGALGYNNGVYLLNDMCAALYSNSSRGITARSINLVDMEKHLTTAGIAARNAYTSEVQYGTTKPYTGDYSYYPNLYASQPGAGINLAEGVTVTQPTIDGTVPDPYNESAEVYTTPTTETYSQATEGTGLTVTQTYYNISINEANYGPAAAVLSQSNSYWVASRYVFTDSSCAYFGLRRASSYMDGNGMFDSNYVPNYYLSYRLRPVVSLSSDLLDGIKDDSGAWNLKSE